MVRIVVLCASLLASLAVAAAPADAIAHLDGLWKFRDTPARAKEVPPLLNKLLKDHPEDYDVLWRGARWLVWEADILPKNDEKRRTAKDAWILAERAVKANPAGAEGHYWAAAAIGNYSQAVGMLKALNEGLEGTFHGHLDAAHKYGPAYEFAADTVARGRAYYELPWPKRDLPRSEALLKEVVAKYPNNLRALLYLSETQLRRGNPTEAQATLSKVQNGSTDYDPPEARRIKAWAAWVRTQIQKEQK